MPYFQAQKINLCSLLCPPLEGRSVKIPRGCGSQKSKTSCGLTRGGGDQVQANLQMTTLHCRWGHGSFLEELYKNKKKTCLFTSLFIYSLDRCFYTVLYMCWKYNTKQIFKDNIMYYELYKRH